MPAKGTHKLTDDERVAVLVDKQLRTSSVKTVAEAHGLAENSLYRIEREASPAVLARVETVVASLADRIAETRDLALQRMQERLGSTAEPAPLNHLTTAFGVLYDKSQLENNKPTSIVQHLITPEEHALDFVKLLLTTMDRQEALSALSIADLNPLVSNATRDRVVLQLTAGEVDFPD